MERETGTINTIGNYLKVRGWKPAVSELGEILMTHPSGDWQVQVSKDGWAALCRFSDADVQVEGVGMVAIPRWITESEYGPEEAQILREEMISIGALEWECPNCGEPGGSPRSVVSREFQGDEAHGGYVEFEDQGCSKCIRSSEPDYEYREVA